MHIPKVTQKCFLLSGLVVFLLVWWATGELAHGLLGGVLTVIGWHGIVFVTDKLHPNKLEF